MSDTTFQDTPLYAWLRANAWFLLAGAALVLGIIVYRENAPAWRQAAQEESWDSFRSLAASASGVEDLATRLGQARQDERIYPWFVFDATRAAAAAADAQALELLKPELEALAKTSSVLVATPDGPQNMAAYLLSKVSGEAAALPASFPLPEPEGSKVEVVVSVNDTTTYTLVIGLYEKDVPQGAGALLEWIAAGRFDNQSARKVGATGLTLSLAPREAQEGEAEPEPLRVERPYGLFHAEGVLTLMQLPGKAGEQDPGNVQILLQDAYYQDGYSTVVGKATEGWAEFKAAMDALDPNAALKVTSVRRL